MRPGFSRRFFFSHRAPRETPTERHRVVAVIGAWTATLLAGPALASPVAIVNSSFESPDAGPAGSGLYILGAPTGWTRLNPSDAQLAAVAPAAIYFPSVPDGKQTLALGNDGGPASVSQTLSALLQGDTTYTLTVFVGKGAGYPLGGYLVELLAGSTTIASNGSLMPGDGSFVLDTLVYAADASDPLIGEPLGIRLSSLVGNAQVNFDAVTLDATASDDICIPIAVGNPGFEDPVLALK